MRTGDSASVGDGGEPVIVHDAIVHDAIVLAGGRGRRLGGLGKAELSVGGLPLLDRALAAASGARRRVVVGPARLARDGVPAVQEDPPFGGPVAGIDAGLTHLGQDGDLPVLVLACDHPLAAPAVPDLLATLAATPGADGAQLVSAEGLGQPLVAVYRRQALVLALRRCRAGTDVAGVSGVHGAAVRRLVHGLTLTGVPDRHGAAEDADTWDAVARLDHALREDHTMTHAAGSPSPGSRSTGAGPAPLDSELDRWVATLVEELGVDPAAVDVAALLDLAREVAHGIARPAAPLTGFLVGYAVGAGDGDREASERVVRRVASLARGWTAGLDRE
ncbi:MAG: NTP transferase domain-containing protein [Actinomycetales bacterium]|nr:NTP transferase domain-containing protein [Actinomycetales bacterium]